MKTPPDGPNVAPPSVERGKDAPPSVDTDQPTMCRPRALEPESPKAATTLPPARTSVEPAWVSLSPSTVGSLTRDAGSVGPGAGPSAACAGAGAGAAVDFVG